MMETLSTSVFTGFESVMICCTVVIRAAISTSVLQEVILVHGKGCRTVAVDGGARIEGRGIVGGSK
jgi:hypothetical protein